MMKKNVLLIIAALLTSIGMFAQPRSEQEAVQIAQDFFSKSSKKKALQLSVVPQQKVSQQIRKKIASAQTAPAQHSSCYIVNDEANNRFVIVSADERMYEILGYSDNGCFEAENAPEGLIDIIYCYDEQYVHILKNTVVSSSSPKRAQVDPIAPLITTNWHQSSPFNLQCPLSSNGRTLSVTGCVATAMAQVMNYWKYPQKGQGEVPVKYITRNTKTFQSMLYDTLQINWNNILETYDNNSTTAQKNEVSKLMHACGISVFMNYDTGSGAFPCDIPYALVHNFGYNPNTICLRKDYYSSTEWKNIIINELKAKRPIIYSGYDMEYGGHEFILDGIDKDELYHFNFGWRNGNGDGYYSIEAIDPNPYNFNFYQDMIINVCPETVNGQKNVLYFDDFKLVSSLNIGKECIVDISFKVHSNMTNSQQFVFDVPIGIGVFDNNWNLIKSLYEVKFGNLSDYGKKIIQMQYRQWPSIQNIKLQFDENTFGKENQQVYIAPYAVHNGELVRGKSYKGEKDWYRATTQNGIIIIETMKDIEDPIPPIPPFIIPDGLVGTFNITALDDITQKTTNWQISVTQDGTDSTKYWFHNIDKALLEEGYSATNGNNLVYGIMKADGNIRIPSLQNVGDNWVLKNYSSSDSILVEISRNDSTMDIRKDVWGISNIVTGEDISRYTQTNFSYPIPGPIPPDTVATPSITVDDKQIMTISCTTKDVTIYYTYSPQGTEPTSQSTVYSSPIMLTHNGIIKAIAFNKDGKSSMVKTYKVQSFTVAKPIITIYDEDAHLISITCPTPSSKIFYTTDGRKPNVNEGSEYHGMITCTKTALIQAMAVRENWNDSHIDSMYYVVEMPLELEINNSVAGALRDKITDEEKLNVQSLKVTGEINGTDIKFIREMINEGKLAYLDLKESSIVSGGEPYYTNSIGTTYSTKVNTVSENMFYQCANLIVLKLPNSAVTLEGWSIQGCKNIKELEIPSSCTTIEDYAISSCQNLEKVYIHSRVSVISGINFSSCQNLNTIKVDPSNPHLQDIDGVLYSDRNTLVKYPCGKKEEQFVIPDWVVFIGEKAFTNSNIQNVSIPLSVKSIKKEAFENCKNLRQITIPNSVTEIGEWVFSGCNKIISATMSSNILEIPSYAFSGCINLMEFGIGSSVQTIAPTAFNNCTSLIMFKVDDENNSFASIDGILYTKDFKELVRCPLAFYSEELIIREGIEVIAKDAFKKCSKIQKISFPQSLISIGDEAFAESSISSVSITDNIKSIGTWAFNRCTELKSFVIPKQITNVESYLLSGCNKLSYLYLSENIKIIGSSALRCKSLSFIDSKIKEIDKLNIDFDTYDQVYSSFKEIPDTCIWRVPSGPIADRNKYARKYVIQPWWVSSWRIIVDDEVEPSTQSISFNESTLRTFSSFKDLDFTGIDGLTAYIASGFSAETGEVIMSKVEKVPACTGLLLIGELNQSYEVPFTETDFVYSNLLEGVTENTTITSGYVLNGGLFEAVAGSQTVNGGEAFLNLPYIDGKKQLKIKPTDTLNGVEDVKLSADNQSPWFTISGSRLTHKPTQRGIYLRGGKKVLVK